MLWSLIVTTVLTGNYVESGPVAHAVVQGFESSRDCREAGMLMKNEGGVIKIGRYQDYTYSNFVCVPMGEKK